MTKGGKSTNKSIKKPVKKASLKVKVVKVTKKKKPKKTTAISTLHSPEKKVQRKSKATKKSLAKKTIKQRKKDLVNKKTAKISSSGLTAGEERISPRILHEKVEREKLFIIRVGVTFVMAAIVVVWIFTLKQSIKMADNSDADQGAMESLQQMSDTVSEKIDQISTDLKKIDDFSQTINQDLNKVIDEEAQTKRITFEEASSSIPLLIDKLNKKETSTGTSTLLSTGTTTLSNTDIADFEQADIEALKKRIEDLENKLSE